MAKPFPLLAVPSSAKQQEQANALFAARSLPMVAGRPHVPKAGNGKIRLGYFSADFCSHATSHLISGVFEKHDRKKFEVIGLALGGHPLDPVRRHVETLVDRMIDISAKSDEDIVSLSRELNLHIALDLNLYTSRQPSFFARGVAPIQV
ncbi:MAG: hypothetical protein RLN70_07840, partial [Rhodospirillaceae bacterium]